MPARTDYAALLELEQDDYALLRFLGEAAYLRMYRGETDAAQAIFEALVDLAPGDPTGNLGQAELLLQTGKARQAVEAARKARRTANADLGSVAFTHLIEAKANLMLDKKKEAREALERAVEVDPGGSVGETARELIGVLASPGSPTPNDPQSTPPARELTRERTRWSESPTRTHPIRGNARNEQGRQSRKDRW